MRKSAVMVGFTVLAVYSIAVLIGRSARLEAAAPDAPGSAITVTDQDNGKSIEVAKDGTVMVRLASNPTTGYGWNLAGDPAPLELVKSDFARDPQARNMAGAGGTQTLQFVAPAAGSAALKLEYRRPWEKDVPAAKSFKVTVVVK